MREALARRAAGDPGGLWVVAGEQTAGRGRRGRAWATPAGNLAATLLLIDPAEPAVAATLGFVAGRGARTRRRAPRCCASAPTASRARPPRAEMAERRARSTAPSSPASCSRARRCRSGGFAVVIGIGVNVRLASRERTLPTLPATSVRSGLPVDARRPVRGARRSPGPASSAIWDRRPRLRRHPRGVAAARRRPRRADRASNLGGSGAGTGTLRDDRRRRAAWSLRRTDGARETVSAGDVHFGAVG